MAKIMGEVYAHPESVPGMGLDLNDGFDDDDTEFPESRSPALGEGDEMERIERHADEGEGLAAKVEALRIFLEETLGVERFYSAYRVLEERVEATDGADSEALDEVHGILGTENLYYLKHIYQLVQCEELLNQHGSGV